MSYHYGAPPAHYAKYYSSSYDSPYDGGEYVHYAPQYDVPKKHTRKASYIPPPYIDPYPQYAPQYDVPNKHTRKDSYDPSAYVNYDKDSYSPYKNKTYTQYLSRLDGENKHAKKAPYVPARAGDYYPPADYYSPAGAPPRSYEPYVAEPSAKLSSDYVYPSNRYHTRSRKTRPNPNANIIYRGEYHVKSPGSDVEKPANPQLSADKTSTGGVRGEDLADKAAKVDQRQPDSSGQGLIDKESFHDDDWGLWTSARGDERRKKEKEKKKQTHAAFVTDQISDEPPKRSRVRRGSAEYPKIEESQGRRLAKSQDESSDDLVPPKDEEYGNYPMIISVEDYPLGRPKRSRRATGAKKESNDKAVEDADDFWGFSTARKNKSKSAKKDSGDTKVKRVYGPPISLLGTMVSRKEAAAPLETPDRFYDDDDDDSASVFDPIAKQTPRFAQYNGYQMFMHHTISQDRSGGQLTVLAERLAPLATRCRDLNPFSEAAEPKRLLPI